MTLPAPLHIKPFVMNITPDDARVGDRVQTGGVYYGPRVFLLWKGEKAAVLHVPHNVQWWGQAKHVIKSAYILVKRAGLDTHGMKRWVVLAEAEPGKAWREQRAKFINDAIGMEHSFNHGTDTYPD